MFGVARFIAVRFTRSDLWRSQTSHYIFGSAAGAANCPCRSMVCHAHQLAAMYAPCRNGQPGFVLHQGRHHCLSLRWKCRFKACCKTFPLGLNVFVSGHFHIRNLKVLRACCQVAQVTSASDANFPSVLSVRGRSVARSRRWRPDDGRKQVRPGAGVLPACPFVARGSKCGRVPLDPA